MGDLSSWLGREEAKDGGCVMSLFLDPRAFNYLIMSLYILNAGRWAYEGRVADVCYWLSAFAITATVTFGYKH